MARNHTFVEDTKNVAHYFTAVLDSKGQEVSREYGFSRTVMRCDCGCKQSYPGNKIVVNPANIDQNNVVIYGITRQN